MLAIDWLPVRLGGLLGRCHGFFMGVSRQSAAAKMSAIEGAAAVATGVANALQLPFKMLVVAGPSGVGKGTLLTRLRTNFPDAFGYSVSHTTRKPREGEENGKHYYFTTRESILEEVEKGLFLEHAYVFGNVYGTSLSEVERVTKSGRICLLEIDVQGVRQVKQSAVGNQANYVFIAPPDPKTLEKRLRGRGTETEEKVKKRLTEAAAELEASRVLGFDVTVVNDDLEEAYRHLESVVVGWYPQLKKATAAL